MCAGQYCPYMNKYSGTCKLPLYKTPCPYSDEQQAEPEPGFVPMSAEEKASLSEFLENLEAGKYDHIFV